VRLLVDGTEVGSGEVARSTPVRHSIGGAGITCGWEQGPPVGPGYDAPFTFAGTLLEVEVQVLEPTDHPRDLAAEFDAVMGEQ
jgi:hypothetical protein